VRTLRVLYVCPFAHYSGHFPHVATTEPAEFAEHGIDADLLTFCGITNDPPLPFGHYRASQSGNGSLFRLLRRNTLSRWCLMLCETALTLAEAVRRYRRGGYDVIYLRDGEPFMFMPHLMSLPFRGIRWAVSLTAAVIYRPKLSRSANPFLILYNLVVGFVINNPLWRLLYAVSLRRNRFMLITQNEQARRDFERYLGGAFKGLVACVPLGVSDSVVPVAKQEARARLGLPQDKIIFLCFGAPHSGKDTRVIFEALQYMYEADADDVLVVFAGRQAFGLADDTRRLASAYNAGEKVAIFDYYIPEEQKPLFFGAADAVILSYTREFKCTSSMLWDAARYRVPVIASNTGELAELVGSFNMGLVFRAGDALSLLATIMYFMGMPRQWIEGMQKGCSNFATTFSTSAWADKSRDIFCALRH